MIFVHADATEDTPSGLPTIMGSTWHLTLSLPLFAAISVILNLFFLTALQKYQ